MNQDFFAVIDGFPPFLLNINTSNYEKYGLPFVEIYWKDKDTAVGPHPSKEFEDGIGMRGLGGRS